MINKGYNSSTNLKSRKTEKFGTNNNNKSSISLAK